MKNSEKGKFENAWLKAFENAEQAPSDEVWAGIEQGLNKTETLMMKRRVAFYQRLAAASILFALLLGGLSVYYITDLSNQQEYNLVQKDLSSSPGSDERENANPPAVSNDINNNLNSTVTTGNGSNAIISEEKSINRSDNVIVNLDQTENKQNEENTTPGKQLTVRMIKNPIDYPALISMIPGPLGKIEGKMKQVTIVRKLPAMPADFMATKNDKQRVESVWASLGASTGNYSPSADFGMGSSSKSYAQSPSGLNNSQGAFSTTASRGTAFSVGMNLGKRISKRWLVQGGISYLNQAIGYTSNYAVVVDANNNVLASVADYSSLKSYSTVVAVASPYEINSVNEYLSFPVQVGYLLIDRKIGLQLNTGLSTDFFIQNTLTDKSGQMASFSSSAGNESPYRTVSWAGLVGTEVSYKIATQYRISIAPGLRYSLNSVLKSDAVSTNPLVWDVGFRFRYIFK